MSWASSEWKVGLPSSAQVKITELETQLEKLQKDRQQRQLQIDRLEALVDGQKKKHEEDRLRVLSMEKEIVQLNTNMEENIRQLLKAQQEVLAKDRNLLNYQNQLDAQKRLYDQESAKVKRLEMEFEQLKNSSKGVDSNEVCTLTKKISELESLRFKQEELIKQLENKVARISKEDKLIHGQAGDHNHLTETIMRLEKECEGLKAANSKLEIELWNKANSDSDCTLSGTRDSARIRNETSKLQLQLEDAKNKISELEKQFTTAENSRHNAEATISKLERELNDTKFKSEQDVDDLKCQLEETENNYLQEKRAVEAVKNYLKDSEAERRLLEEEINELRLHVQNNNSNLLVNQELLALRDRCMKQTEQIKQLQHEKQDNMQNDKVEKLQELLERRENEIKHLTKAQKDQDNQLQLMQKKLHAGEELIHSMNIIVNEHKTKCVDDRLELENCKAQLKENVQAVQMLEIEKRQLKKAIQIKESIIQSLMKGDADSSKGMLKNQVVELRLKCEEYESKITEMSDEFKTLQNKEEKSSYSSTSVTDRIKDLESELKMKQLQLDECIQELNNFREITFTPRSSTSEIPSVLTRKLTEKEAKLTATINSMEKLQTQFQGKEKELRLVKQRCESLEKDFYNVSTQLEALQKAPVQQQPVEPNQIESMRNELHKKDKLIRHLQNEMGSMQNITLQIEDFQTSIKERDEKIFQLETDLDSEQRLKEERNLAVLTQQNKIKSLQSELDERDATIAEMRNAHDENEMSTQYLRTIQANLQTELQEKENQCSVLQLELNKVQNICQEAESGNRTLQCQVEELKNRLEKVTMDKEESDNSVSCLQMELFNLKNELQTTYKSAEKAREKMEHKTNEIVALSVELEKKERHIISQQIQLDKLLRSHEEQDACIHSLMSRLTSLQSDIEEKEKSSGIFSLQPDFLSSKTGLNPKVLQAELWAMKSQLESKEKQLEKARLHLEERDGSIQFLRTLLVTLQNDLEEKEKSSKSIQQQLTIAEESVKKQETLNFDLQKQLKSALKENEEKVNKITAALNEVELAHRDQEDKKTRIQNLRSQMHTMQTKLESTLKEKEEKKSTISALRSQIQSLQNKIQMAQKDREDKRACIQALQSELQVLQDEVDVSRKVNDKKEHKIQLLNSQLGALKLELEEREKIINTLHSEMAMLRQNDTDKDTSIDKLTLQLQTAQSKYESSCLAVQSLQTEIQNLKTMNIKEMKEGNATSPNKKNFESYVQMLVSEMESMQYTLQSTQSEWEEKEDAFHAIANHVHKLQAKLEEKRQITSTLEQDIADNSDQTKECRLRCLLMETQLLQDELESKEAALMDATQQLRQSGEQRRRVEQEVGKLLTEMEEIQQGQEKNPQANITPETPSEDRKEAADEPSRQLKLQLVQATSRIEILMSDTEEMRNAMEILEFEKLELQESQETLLCENQNLHKKIKQLEHEVEQLGGLSDQHSSQHSSQHSNKPARQVCSLCNEYHKEIKMLKEIKENNSLKMKEQELELIRSNQELNTVTTNLDVLKASLLTLTEERDKAIFELSLIEKGNGNQASPTEALMLQLEMKAQKEIMSARMQEIMNKFLLTVKEHCTLLNELGLGEQGPLPELKTAPTDDENVNVLDYVVNQHQHILHEIIEFKRSACSDIKSINKKLELKEIELMDKQAEIKEKKLELKAKNTEFFNYEENKKTIVTLEADKLQLSQLLNDKISQLEDVLKSLESLTDRTMLLEKEKNEIQSKANEKLASYEKVREEVVAYEAKIDSMSKTISSMAVDHKELCDALNFKLKNLEEEKADLEKNYSETKNNYSELLKKYQLKCDRKEELGQKFDSLCQRFDELMAEKNKAVDDLKEEKSKRESLESEKNEWGNIMKMKEDDCFNLLKMKEEDRLSDYNKRIKELKIQEEEWKKREEQLLKEVNASAKELKSKCAEIEECHKRLTVTKSFFETVLDDLELMLSDVTILVKAEKNDVQLKPSCVKKLSHDKCLIKELVSCAEKLERLQSDMIVVKDNLNNMVRVNEDQKSELLCTLMQKNQNLQFEHEKTVELENCIAKLNEELMDFKVSLENEKLELVQKHLLEIEQMKEQIEAQKQVEENNKAMVDSMTSKVTAIEEEKVQLLDNVSQHIKSLEHRKAQLSAMKQELKIMKKEKEQIIGIILVREETIRDLEQKLKKLMSENKTKCESIYRLEQSVHDIEDQLKSSENEKNRLAEIIKTLTEKIADLENVQELAIERTKRLNNLENKLQSLSTEVKENEKRFQTAENQLKTLMTEQSTSFDGERNQYERKRQEFESERLQLEKEISRLGNKIEELDEHMKERQYELEREKERHAIDNARKSNCEVDLKEKIDALNNTIQQLQLEKADLLLSTTERISELEDLTDNIKIKNQELQKKVEELEDGRVRKLEEEKLTLQNALTDKLVVLEEERKVIFDQLQELEKVKCKLIYEIREKDGKINNFEETLNNSLRTNQELEKAKSKLLIELKEKEGKILSFEETINETLRTNQELEKAKNKLMIEMREKEDKLLTMEERIKDLSCFNQDLEKHRNKLKSDLKEKEDIVAMLEEGLKEVNQDLEKVKSKMRNKEEKVVMLEERVSIVNATIQSLEKDKKEKEEYCIEIQKKLEAAELEIQDKDGKLIAKCQDIEKELHTFMSVNQKLENDLKQALQLNEELNKSKAEMIDEMTEKEECLQDSWTTNQELERVKKNLQTEIRDKEEKLQSTLMMNQELEKAKNKLIKEMRDKQEQMISYEEQLKDTVTINQDLEKVKIKYFAQIREKDEKIQELENKKSILETENEELTKAIREQEEMVTTFKKSNQEHVISNKESNCLIEALKGQVTQLEKEKNQALEELTGESQRLTELQKRFETNGSANLKLRDENLEKTAILERLQISVTKLREEKDAVSLQLNAINEKHSKCIIEIEQMNETFSTKMQRMDVLQAENQRLKDQLQDLEQNVVLLTESKKNLMSEFMLQKEESNRLNEQITDLTLELERRLHHTETEKGSLDELQSEVDTNNQNHDENYLVLTLFKEKLESQLACATKELAELRAQVAVLQGDNSPRADANENGSTSCQSSDRKDSQNIGECYEDRSKGDQ